MDPSETLQVIKRIRNVSIVLALAASTTTALLIWLLGNTELLPTILFWILGIHQLFYVFFFKLLASSHRIAIPLAARSAVIRGLRSIANREAVFAVIMLGVVTFFLFPPSWLPLEAHVAAILLFIIVAAVREARALLSPGDGKQATGQLREK